MPTVNKQIAESIIANNGMYSEDGVTDSPDPQVIAVIRYENTFNGNYAYAICYSANQVIGYFTSASCIDPIILAATQEILDGMKASANMEESSALAALVYSQWVSATVKVFPTIK